VMELQIITCPKCEWSGPINFQIADLLLPQMELFSSLNVLGGSLWRCANVPPQVDGTTGPSHSVRDDSQAAFREVAGRGAQFP
jgi:hypothetical protein